MRRGIFAVLQITTLSGVRRRSRYVCGEGRKVACGNAGTPTPCVSRPASPALCLPCGRQGIAARQVLLYFCRGDPSSLRSLSCRFSKTVLPGEQLEVRDTCRFILFYETCHFFVFCILYFNSQTTGQSRSLQCGTGFYGHKMYNRKH